MGEIKKAIISLICLIVFAVLWKLGYLSNYFVLLGVGAVFAFIMYIFWIKQ